MVTKAQIMNALKEVYDPEIPVNIVDMGLIYDVKTDKDKVHVKMTLSSPGCPLSLMITQMVQQKVESIKGVKQADVELTFEPRWTPQMMTKEARKKFGL